MANAGVAPRLSPALDRLRRGLGVMGRVIYALILRESRTRYGDSDLGYIWAMLEPFVMVTLLTALFVLLNRRLPAGASIPVFVISGILPYIFWRGCASRGGTAIASNAPLLVYPQVRPVDLVIARCVLDFCTFVILTLIFVVGLRFVTGEPFSSWTKNPPQIIAAIATLFLFALATSLFNSSLTRVMPRWENIFSYLSRPLWWTSGVFYTLETVPMPLRTYLAYNPIAQLIEWIRAASFPGFNSTAYNPWYPIGFGFGLLFIGLAIDWMVRLTGRDDNA